MRIKRNSPMKRTLCKEVGGWQDQIAASFVGYNRINFNADFYENLPVIISKKANLMMFLTGFTDFPQMFKETIMLQQKISVRN